MMLHDMYVAARQAELLAQGDAARNADRMRRVRRRRRLWVKRQEPLRPVVPAPARASGAY